MSDRAAVEAAADRILARESLYFYSRLAFLKHKRQKWQRNRHHGLICSALEDVFHGRTKRLIINLPPRYSKTELAVVKFIGWSLGQCPDAEFIHTSYAALLATKNSAEAKADVSSDWYAALFPDTRIAADTAAKADWKTTEGGRVYAVGSGGSTTGFGAGKMRAADEPYKFGGAIIIDDPHKADEARSDVVRKGVIDWYHDTLQSRTNSPDTPIILIMQRLHEADLAGHLLAGGSGETWTHLNLPAIQDDGTALWPEKHSIERLQQMQLAAPYMFAGQYQQNPAPLEGNIFKPGKMDVVDEIPPGTSFVRGWDFGGTEGGGDPTAGGKLGKMPDGRFVIADMTVFQGAPETVRAELVSTAKRDGTATKIRIPQRGPRRALVDLADKNAQHLLEEFKLAALEADERAVDPVYELQRELGLPRLPRSLICFDISHAQGTDVVASAVWFENGRPKRADHPPCRRPPKPR